jgi:OmpA-OmpF porin, OOP family
MNSRFLGTAALATVLAAATPAHAEGLYIGAFGGVNFAQDSDFKYDGGPGYEAEFDIEHDTGWLAGAAVGYGFDYGVRVEAEAAYRMNDFERIELGGAGADLDGDVSTLSIMGNLWFEAPMSTALRPFVGAGVGMAQVSINDAEVQGTSLADDSDWVFAYQVGGGLAYRVAAGTDVTAEYRYFATDDAEVGVDGGGGGDGDGEYEYGSHSVLIGLRYSFQ